MIGDQNNYLVLFDAIDRQSEYDEVKLLNKFRNEPFVKRFSIAKSRMYNAILKSLDAYHANSSVEAQLKRQLQYTIRSTKRYLETRNKVYRFETIFLEFVNDLLHKRKSFTDAERYGELAKALRPLRDDAFEKHAFEYFDFLTWAEGAAARLNTQRA